MAAVDDTGGNVFDQLPDTLVGRILAQCSPLDQMRAAATCHTLWRALHEHNKHLISHSITFDVSTDENMISVPLNVGKLQVSLKDSYPYADNIYRKMQSFVERAKQGRLLDLKSVQELRVDNSIAFCFCQHSMQLLLLLQLFPNLTTICFNGIGGWEVLVHNGLHSLSRLCRLSVTVPIRRVSLPSFPVTLNALCLTVHGAMEPLWLQPLSQLPQLRYLYLLTFWERDGLEQLVHVTSLRHLKLWSRYELDMRTIARLQQLNSLCLCDTEVMYPKALAQLDVTSLTLQSVITAQSPSRQESEYHPAGQCWPKLSTVKLAGTVSEKLLQAMLLPHPGARGLDVRASCEELHDGQFGSGFDYSQALKPSFAAVAYKANAEPVLGPAYFSATRIDSLRLQGRCAVEALRQLLLMNTTVSSRQWRKIFFLRCCLRPFLIRGDQRAVTVTNIRPAADGSEIMLIRSAGLNYRFDRHSSSAKYKLQEQFSVSC